MEMTTGAGEGPALRDAHLPIRIGRTIWENLALLLMIDGALALAVFPVLVLALGGLPLLALSIAVLVCGPVWASAAATADLLNRDDSAITVGRWFGLVRDHARQGMVVSMVPIMVVAALVVTLDALAGQPNSTLLQVALLLECSVMIVVAVSGIAVFSLATTNGLRGWTLWRASLAVGVANPLMTIGSLALLVVLAFLVFQVGVVLLAIIPAPCAVWFSAMTWSTVDRHAAR